MVTKENIDKFLANKQIAIVGASRKPKSFSAQVASHLQKIGYEVFYVNPAFVDETGDIYHFADINQLPEHVDAVLFLTSKTRTKELVEASINKGIKNLWIQQMSDTPEAVEVALKAGVNLVFHNCIFMFTNPVGVHKFHYCIKKFFGGMPK